VSHGQYALELWRTRHEFDYISLIDLVALSLALVLLSLDLKDRLRNRPAHNAQAG
jgi:hypothetical protein